MAEEIFPTPGGTWRIQGWIPGILREAFELMDERGRRGDTHAEFVPFHETTAYLKAGGLKGKARWRHGLRRHVLRARAPRVQEYFNLAWLHNRHFQVALPLSAGVLLRRGLPRYQFLLTRRVDDGRPLLDAIAEEPPTIRRVLFEELGREVARMHALGYVHHDLYARNLLVVGSQWPRRVVFLDTWAGGESFHLRSPAYDLACLFLEGADLFDPDDQRTFLATYVGERRDQGRPIRAGLFARVRREREALLRRLQRNPARLRGRPMPGPWPPSESFLSDLDPAARR